MSLRVLIVDDEPVARRRIRRLLTHESDIDIVAECNDGRAAVDAIRTHAPDLVFLDVQMPELGGFEVLRALGGTPLPAIVFVTAFDQYALEAFEVHALDYLLKPFGAERFRQTLQRARAELARPRQRLADPGVLALLKELGAARRHRDRFVIKSGGRIRLVDCRDVDWIQASDNYVTLHTGTTAHLLRETMTWIEAELDPERFVRIHRSTIVQLDRIKELVPAFHGEFAVVLRDGTRLTLSRSYRERIEKRLGRRL